MSHPGKGPEVCPPAEGAPAAGAGAGFAFVVVVFVLLVIIGAVIVRPY
ncbi:sporulation protein YjcZ [Evansella sp. LMS18]|nr:sporulation protein YjcZ [Evansella sp. LMS18]UTR11960.1 sporulation protein YjcZ [Evansella sp. LMS18]